MTVSPSAFIRGTGSLLAGLGVTIKAMFQPVVTSQYPRQLLNISPRFRGHIKLLASTEDPGKNGCIACGICAKNCPSGSIKNIEGEKEDRNILCTRLYDMQPVRYLRGKLPVRLPRFFC
jgi:formate hydrogenlyase subunit 6/NADH:ubiquinone oxidoreductase subunit I